MLNDQRALTLVTRDQEVDDHDHDHDSPIIRDIHPLTPPPSSRAPRREAWETASHRSSNLSIGSTTTTEGGENFTTMSREFNALVLAGSTIAGTSEHEPGLSSLTRISEENHSHRDTNPLAIVPDSNPMESPRGAAADRLALTAVNGREVSVQRVKKEEIESKINAWQNAKIAKINNRFKREDAVINGLEGEQVQKATSWMKKIERKLEEKRAKAQEKMQNEIAKAHRKAEERRASAEGKRGIKVAKILEIANLMRAVGRPPAKRSFF